MPNGDSKTQQIEFEGTTHEFPADFTQDDITKALKTYGKPTASTAAPDAAKPDSILGGFGRRAADTVKGAYDTFAKPPEGTLEKTAAGVAGPGGLIATRLGKGAYESSKRKLTQAATDLATDHPFKAVLHGVIEQDPTSPIGPLSPTQSQADLVEQGRYREAIGSAGFDAFAYWLGGKLGGKLSDRAAANKLHSAVGGDVDPIRQVMPDLAETAKTGGKPVTVQDAQQLVSDTTDRLSAEFDKDFAPIAKNRIYTPVIKQRLQQILDKNPQWRKTPEGRAKVDAINDTMRVYDKTGWTFEEMNKERGDLRGQIRALNKQAPSDAAARIRHDADVAAKSAVADVMSDTVNDWLSHQTGKPKAYYDALRQKQARLIDLEDQLDTRVTELHNKQAAHEAAGAIGRFKLHAYASPSSEGVFRGHISGIHDALSQGPEMVANKATRAAFKSSKHPIAGAAVKSLPVDALTERGKDESGKRRSTIPPPPEPPQ